MKWLLGRRLIGCEGYRGLFIVPKALAAHRPHQPRTPARLSGLTALGLRFALGMGTGDDRLAPRRGATLLRVVRCDTACRIGQATRGGEGVFAGAGDLRGQKRESLLRCSVSQCTTRRACEKMGTGTSRWRDFPGRTHRAAEPVPIFSQARTVGPRCESGHGRREER